MNKKLVSAILCGAMVLAAATPVMADGGAADGKKIALVGKSAGNAFFEIAANSFKETVEAEGGTVDVVYPEAATADAQIKVLDNLISQKPDAICISANDVNALQAKLEEAMDAGIKVSSFDSAPNKVFEGNAQSLAVLKKCGFVLHHCADKEQTQSGKAEVYLYLEAASFQDK